MGYLNPSEPKYYHGGRLLALVDENWKKILARALEGLLRDKISIFLFSAWILLIIVPRLPDQTVEAIYQVILARTV